MPPILMSTLTSANADEIERIPLFDIGQTDGVRPYVLSVLPGLASRIGLDERGAAEMQHLMTASLDAALDALPRFMEAPFAPAIPEGRILFDWIGEHLLLPDSELIGADYVGQALELAARGANILIVGNHTSGADHPAMEFLVNRALGSAVTHHWRYMSGHVVNLFAVPLMLSGGIHRYQIVSVRYQHVSTEREDGRVDWMRRRNQSAVMALARDIQMGGQITVMYPEGGRGTNALKAGEPRTMKIPEVMARACSHPLYVLPCYVEGATSVLPVYREIGEREFTAVLCLARPGTVQVRFGAPVRWDDLVPTTADLKLEANADRDAISVATKEYLLRQVMGQIANLCPNEVAKGPYGQS